MTETTDPFQTFVERLREAFFALRGVSDALLADLDCSAAERSVLAELDARGPQTVPAMAQARAVSRQAMQKSIDRLAGRKWLAATDNPRHQRSPLIALAPAGRKVLGEIRKREQRLLARAELPVSGTELERAAHTLAKVGQHLRQLEVSGGKR